MPPQVTPSALAAALERYEPVGEREELDVRRLLDLVASGADPWSRSEPLHVTASALVVDARSQRVLLRWHERFGRFQQVGGHGDAGEDDPLEVALREAREETGLEDVYPFVRPGRLGSGDLVHVAVVPVPARRDESAHEHGDLRYLLGTDRPEAATAEHTGAPLQWVSWDDAAGLTASANLSVLLSRSRALLE
ncbi:MAG: NUDIX domain-containing protein [Acidimicrobiales bacterium]